MSNPNPKTYAVIAAAGSGQRMGGVSKPNILLLGKTLFEYVIDAFEKSNVDGITVVCSEDNEDSLRALAKDVKKPITFVRGGKTRSASVFLGINASREADVICVHDCARPFITPEIINKTIETAISFGASCVCSPATDTLKQKNPDGSISTLDRSKIFAVQTPQCFKKLLYFRACRKAKGNTDFTDETSFLEAAGYKVEYITTYENNMKLTSKSDVPLAEAIMKSRGSNL